MTAGKISHLEEFLFRNNLVFIANFYYLSLVHYLKRLYKKISRRSFINFNILINLLDPPTRAGRMCNYGTACPKSNLILFL